MQVRIGQPASQFHRWLYNPFKEDHRRSTVPQAAVGSTENSDSAANI